MIPDLICMTKGNLVAARSKAWVCGRSLTGIVGSNLPIPVAVRSKAWVCGRSLTGIVGSNLPIPVAARSKAWVYGRSLTGIVGSNPNGGMDVCVVCCKDGSMERKVTWRTKGFEQYKNVLKGKTPDRHKKNPA
jgi:hypothetical protein